MEHFAVMDSSGGFCHIQLRKRCIDASLLREDLCNLPGDDARRIPARPHHSLGRCRLLQLLMKLSPASSSALV